MRRRRRCGPHLAQQAVLAVQVEETGVPAVREHGVLPGLLIDGEPGPAATVLVGAQVRHRSRRLVQHRVRGGGKSLVHDRPGDPGMPGRLRRGDSPLGDRDHRPRNRTTCAMRSPSDFRMIISRSPRDRKTAGFSNTAARRNCSSTRTGRTPATPSNDGQ